MRSLHLPPFVEVEELQRGQLVSQHAISPHDPIGYSNRVEFLLDLQVY